MEESQEERGSEKDRGSLNFLLHSQCRNLPTAVKTFLRVSELSPDCLSPDDVHGHFVAAIEKIAVFVQLNAMSAEKASIKQDSSQTQEHTAVKGTRLKQGQVSWTLEIERCMKLFSPQD